MTQISLNKKIFFINANIFDGEHDSLRKGSIVVNDKIVEHVFFDDEAHAPAPEDHDMVIDVQGRVLTPGFIDCHTHVMLGGKVDEMMTMSDWEIGIRGAKSLESMLMRGFTSARDAGGADGSIAKLVEGGTIKGPRVFPCGAFISQTSGHFDFDPVHGGGCKCHSYFKNIRGLAYIADGPEQVLQAARVNLKSGATQIKIAVSGGVASPYDPIDSTQYTLDEVKAAVSAAESWNTYVMAHCYHDQGAKLAIEGGVKSIEHGHLLEEDTVKRCKELGVVIQTQYAVYHLTLANGAKMGLGPEQIRKAQQLQTGLKKIGTLLKKHEVLTGFGTDLLGPMQIYQNLEFTLRKEYFSNFEILRQATSESATILEMCGDRNRCANKLGVIRPGAAADILIHEQNPLDDVSVMEQYEKQLRIIMKDGVIYKNTLCSQ